MDISVFTTLLRSEIINLGVPEDSADKYIRSIEKNLTASDIANISTTDIAKFARACAGQIMNKKTSPTQTFPCSSDSEHPSAAVNKEHTKPAIVTASNSANPPQKDDIYAENDGFSEIIPPETKAQKISGRGRFMFILITALSSPLWLAAIAVFLAPFIAVFASEIVLIAVFVCLLAGCAALGTAASLTGIVYGIIKMFSTPAVGLYEIGFGVIIAGITIICGILIYNGTVRFMPWLIKKSARLFKLTFSKVKPLLSEYKRRCEKL